MACSSSERSTTSDLVQSTRRSPYLAQIFESPFAVVSLSDFVMNGVIAISQSVPSADSHTCRCQAFEILYEWTFAIFLLLRTAAPFETLSALSKTASRSRRSS